MCLAYCSPSYCPCLDAKSHFQSVESVKFASNLHNDDSLPQELLQTALPVCLFSPSVFPVPWFFFCVPAKLSASPILFVPCLFIQWESGLAGLESKLAAIIKPVVSTSTTPNPGSNQQIQTHSYNHVPDTKIWVCSCSSCQHMHMCICVPSVVWNHQLVITNDVFHFQQLGSVI